METQPPAISSFGIKADNTRYKSTCGSYTGKVMLGSIPKVLIIVSVT